MLTRNTFHSSLLLIIMLCPSIGFTSSSSDTEPAPLPLNELRAFTEAYYQIKASYVKPVDDVTLIRAAISGMVGSLDSHSRFFSPEEYVQFNADNVGEYAGIGLQFNDHKFGLEIAQVIKSSPAFRAGLKPGMIVTRIDKQEIRYLPASEAVNKLKGEVDSEVELTVAAAEFAKPKDFILKREMILVESVHSESLPKKTGYVALSQFTLNSVNEFKDAINQLAIEQPLERLIIDLRDNPGGVMETAVELSDLFVDEGKLLISRGRTEDSNEVFYAHQDAPFANLQVVLVINGGSASASEIMAAALQDHHKAIVLGERSYGKGSIQTLFSLNQESGIKLTTAEYFSPLGSKIQDIGVEPDIKFSDQQQKNPYTVSLLDDPQLLQAYNLILSLKK